MHSKLLPKWTIYLFFIIGLISAFLFRIIIILKYIGPGYSRLAWYAGVIGYIFFFGFRFFISHKRRKTIIDNNLQAKISASNLEEIDKEDINYILNSLLKSKEMFNYIFIFVLSGVAIIADVLLYLCLGS